LRITQFPEGGFQPARDAMTTAGTESNRRHADFQAIRIRVQQARRRDRPRRPDARDAHAALCEVALKRDSSRRRYFLAKQYRVLAVRM
jgi:hypothetical protein